MSHPKVSKRKAQVYSTVLFLVGLAIISYLHTWWPGIMLVVGIPLALRQYLLGRYYDVFVTLFVFLGVFITVLINAKWDILLPILFVVGAIYIFFREYFESKTAATDEEEENLNEEIEEEQDQQKKRKK